MKKGLLVLFSLLLITSAFAFTKGAMLVGGTASISIDKVDKDADAVTIVEIAPEFGYFVIDKLCVDIIVAMQTMTDEDDSMTTVAAGLGGRYFFDKLYAGADLQMARASMDIEGLPSTSVSAFYGAVKAGYLIPVSNKTFVDLRGLYQRGFGDYGGDRNGKNEEGHFGFKAGLQVLF